MTESRRSTELDTRLRRQRVLARSDEPPAVPQRHVGDRVERGDSGQANTAPSGKEQDLLPAHAVADRVHPSMVDREPGEGLAG
jgi:hypothetical protein